MKEQDFLDAGFIRDKDPMFPFRKELVNWEEVEDNDLDISEIPCLLFGNSGINRGFCIYTGEHFVFFNAENPKDAVQFAERITNFEAV